MSAIRRPWRLNRRDLLRWTAAGAATFSSSRWIETLAAEAQGKQTRSCILLWMSGGPSQIDTFDCKPGHANGGMAKEIATSVPGLRLGEFLPKIAQQANRLAVIRSLTSKEGDHSRATYFLRNGYLPVGAIRYPTLGSLVAKELGNVAAELPNFISISPARAISPGTYSAGFLGSAHAPLLVDDSAAGGADADSRLKVQDLEPASPLTEEHARRRLEILAALNRQFVEQRPTAAAIGFQTAYERAARLMRSDAGKAFALDDEAAAVRDAYGRNRFGQGCLLARRLVERGVPFVEVTLGATADQAVGWDTHVDNLAGVRRLCEMLDPAWAALLNDLHERGLLESTLVVWMGEFGRTPRINDNAGRDHYPQAFSAVLAGGGIRGGQAIGRTSADGGSVEDHPVTVPDFLATVCRALGIDPMTQNESNVGRPIRLVDPAGKPIAEALA